MQSLPFDGDMVEESATQCPRANATQQLAAIAAKPPALGRYFSLNIPQPAMPQCIRCPNCKGCQLHMQFCSGAYGLRHTLAWIVNRKPPARGEARTIRMCCDTEKVKRNRSEGSVFSSICRFEVGPAVVQQHLTDTSREQVIETARRGGKEGPFAGVRCPRPVPFMDVYYAMFIYLSRRNRKVFSVLQRTAMRSVMGQSKALWEKLTFSSWGRPPAPKTEKDRSPEKEASENTVPRRVLVDWMHPPLFFSLLPSAKIGNSGLSYTLWLPLNSQRYLTTYVVDVDFWLYPHSCGLQEEPGYQDCEWVKEPVYPPKEEGEIRCRRCFRPGNHWGFIANRHRERIDTTVTILRVRRSSVRRRVERRVFLRDHEESAGWPKNQVVWVSKHKTRAQFMALIVAYLMYATVCGPIQQRCLDPPDPVAGASLPTEPSVK
ncbi:hypothetical protein ERJ75_001425300 [Trypanosoma vivax]|uniref:Uncharacterized protein n=1 Tax=Trypanosoma vivax (strain Y486) TaxID=1055687 RepID=G0TUL3_TRYVY|nr:hypothetical protein TRVL_03976 [Trypanosoma vivax]KAH8607060.1 hypothetical protein ERJ75_001425300 [Trypanosoma vivax]CCC47648.1 conserved hypothetical protein [Trypanosoma vivax Y486]